MTDRSFGIEIEMVNATSAQVSNALNAAGITCVVTGYGSATRAEWKVQGDGSLRPGPNQTGSCELVSPILRGEDGYAQVRTVCAVLASINAKINKSCGLHVHLGI